MFSSRLFSLSVGLLLAAGMTLGQPTLTERNPPYRLQAGDSIELQYRLTPEYNCTATVQPGGLVSLPLIGDIKLQGLTVAEAQSALVEKASVRLNQPELTVLLKDFVRPYFIVGGEVGHPGRFDMHGDVTALEAIAISGGFKDSSKHSQVLLIRKFNTEVAEVKLLDMKAMSTQNGVVEDPQLRPGDILLVPQNVVSKLERYVRWSSVGMWGVSLLH
jgi:polysaccharide export outer membrane protein